MTNDNTPLAGVRDDEPPAEQKRLADERAVLEVYKGVRKPPAELSLKTQRDEAIAELERIAAIYAAPVPGGDYTDRAMDMATAATAAVKRLKRAALADDLAEGGR